MTDPDDRKRAAALADDIEAAFNRLPYEAMGLMLAANGTSIVRALRAYAAPATANCAHCGRIVDTREVADGGGDRSHVPRVEEASA